MKNLEEKQKNQGSKNLQLRNPGLTKLAKGLRKRATAQEQILWSRLRGKVADGLKFKRQHPVGGYIVDFICIERELIIEVDGRQHGFDEDQTHDDKRDEKLKSLGYRILRIPNSEINRNLDGVLISIWAALEKTG